MSHTPEQPLHPTDLDGLSAAEVAALESALLRDPAAASAWGRAGRGAAERDPLVGQLAAIEARAGAQPGRDGWRAVWAGIERGLPSPQRTGQVPAMRRTWTLRIGGGIAALAASLLLALGWWSLPEPTGGTVGWPARLARDAVIETIEADAGSTPMVVSTGGEDGIAVIWFVQAEG